MIQENSNFLWFSTRGPSMFPLIRGNDCILVKKEPVETIQPGDIIVFESKPGIKVCHCVVKIEERGGVLWFYTKGYKDNSCDNYDMVRQDKVLGKMIAIKRKFSIIKLSARGLQLLLFKLDCFLAEIIFHTKVILVKIPFLKKIHRRFFKI